MHDSLKRFLKDRYGETAGLEDERGFSNGEIADSCGYLVDSLYIAGEGQEATVEQRRLSKAGCIFDVTKAIAGMAPPNAAERANFGTRTHSTGRSFAIMRLITSPDRQMSPKRTFSVSSAMRCRACRPTTSCAPVRRRRRGSTARRCARASLKSCR